MDELGALVVDVYEDNCADEFAGVVVEHGFPGKAAAEGAEVEEGDGEGGFEAGDKVRDSRVVEEEPVLEVVNGQGGEFGGSEVVAVGGGEDGGGLDGGFG